ncbi:MAG: hypothetical protein ABMB14_15945 [Myxococcota bacterium]
MIAWLVVRSAFAQATCPSTPELVAPPPAVSVAWVSPLGRRARGKAWLYVVPTADLRAYAQDPSHPDAARVLQWLGARRSGKPPSRRYKVVVFDTRPEAICRPIRLADGADPALAGVPACDEDHAGPQGRYAGCGWATDQATGQPSIQVYRAQWNTLAANGFCLLPFDRFLR